MHPIIIFSVLKTVFNAQYQQSPQPRFPPSALRLVDRSANLFQRFYFVMSLFAQRRHVSRAYDNSCCCCCSLSSDSRGRHLWEARQQRPRCAVFTLAAAVCSGTIDASSNCDVISAFRRCQNTFLRRRLITYLSYTMPSAILVLTTDVISYLLTYLLVRLSCCHSFFYNAISLISVRHWSVNHYYAAINTMLHAAALYVSLSGHTISVRSRGSGSTKIACFLSGGALTADLAYRGFMSQQVIKWNTFKKQYFVERFRVWQAILGGVTIQDLPAPSIKSCKRPHRAFDGPGGNR